VTGQHAPRQDAASEKAVADNEARTEELDAFEWKRCSGAIIRVTNRSRFFDSSSFFENPKSRGG